MQNLLGDILRDNNYAFEHILVVASRCVYLVEVEFSAVELVMINLRMNKSLTKMFNNVVEFDFVFFVNHETSDILSLDIADKHFDCAKETVVSGNEKALGVKLVVASRIVEHKLHLAEVLTKLFCFFAEFLNSRL